MKFYFALFVAIFFLLTNLALSNPPAALSHQEGSHDHIYIHMSESGYEPREIVIETGQTVVFENTGSTQHWPASDSHPSHTFYDGTTVDEHCQPDSEPTFDACGAIEPGDSWSFTFDRPGNFEFHDHLWPQLTGTITVEGDDLSSFEPAEAVGKKAETTNQGFFAKIIQFFVSIKNRLLGESTGQNQNLSKIKTGHSSKEELRSLSQSYLDLLEEQDPGTALRTLADDSESDEKLMSFCHDILHDLGHAAFEKHGSFEEAAKYQTDFCNSGYLHGVFEAYFETVDDPLSEVGNLCDSINQTKSKFEKWQCNHGIGHGIMYLTGGDLDESLQLCADYLDGENIESCQNGVYMEVFNAEILAKETQFVDHNQPFKTCADRNILPSTCYLYAPTYFSQTLNMDFAQIMQECNQIDPKHIEICKYGVGTEAIKRNMNNPEVVFELCKTAGSKSHQEACARGVVSMYTNQKPDLAEGSKLCETAPSEFQSACREGLKSKEILFN